MQNSNPYRIESVDRALDILTMLGTGRSVSVTQAQKELGVAPSTAHRILATLVGKGFAVQGKDRLYYPGPALLSPGRNQTQKPLPAMFRPFLETLYSSVEETVNLAVLTDNDLLFIDGIEGKQNLRVGLRTGIRMPAHLTSGGKAIRQMKAAGYPKDRVFFGINVNESEKGVTALGIALGTFNGQDVAISIAIPSARCTNDRQARLRKELAGIANAVRRTVPSH